MLSNSTISFEEISKMLQELELPVTKDKKTFETDFPWAENRFFGVRDETISSAHSLDYDIGLLAE